MIGPPVPIVARTAVISLHQGCRGTADEIHDWKAIHVLFVLGLACFDSMQQDL